MDNVEKFKLEISDESITCAGDQPGVVGPDRVLLDGDDNLIEGTTWEGRGYTVEPFIEPAHWTALCDGLRDRVRDCLIEGGATLTEDFRLERYHRYVAGDEELHLRTARTLAKGFPVTQLAIDPLLIVSRIEEICGKPLTLLEPGTDAEGFYMRAVRPHAADNNPLHRDPWLDHLRNAVNLYVPIAGSTEVSSLAIVPGSHHWKESEIARTDGGALVGKARFSVPALVGARRRVEVVRPNPGENEVLVFSPYLLHGGASNLNDDATRVSLEIRLWRAPA